MNFGKILAVGVSALMILTQEAKPLLRANTSQYDYRSAEATRHISLSFSRVDLFRANLRCRQLRECLVLHSDEVPIEPGGNEA